MDFFSSLGISSSIGVVLLVLAGIAFWFLCGALALRMTLLADGKFLNAVNERKDANLTISMGLLCLFTILGCWVVYLVVRGFKWFWRILRSIGGADREVKLGVSDLPARSGREFGY